MKISMFTLATILHQESKADAKKIVGIILGGAGVRSHLYLYKCLSKDTKEKRMIALFLISKLALYCCHSIANQEASSERNTDSKQIFK